MYFSSTCQEKQEDLHWLLRCVLRTISLCQDTGKLFAFLPEFYIESAIYLFQALWNYFMPLTSSGNVQGIAIISFYFILFDIIIEQNSINNEFCFGIRNSAYCKHSSFEPEWKFCTSSLEVPPFLIVGVFVMNIPA